MSDPSTFHGVYYDMPDAVYRQAPGLSQSMMRLLARSPAHLKEAMDHPEPETDAMRVGRAVHQAVLQPDLPKWWVERPEGIDLRTKEGKEWRASAGDAVILPANSVTEIAAAVHAHPTAMKALADGWMEVSLFANGRAANMPESLEHVIRKGRVDCVGRGDSLIDLKTCEDARPKPFAWSALSLCYHVQAAYYLDLWNALAPDEHKEHFVLIAVEKARPHAVAIYFLDQAAIEMGRAQYRRMMDLYAWCRKTDDWPGYNPEPTKLEMRFDPPP